jgi:hypothetical protein
MMYSHRSRERSLIRIQKGNQSLKHWRRGREGIAHEHYQMGSGVGHLPEGVSVEDGKQVVGGSVPVELVEDQTRSLAEEASQPGVGGLHGLS